MPWAGGRGSRRGPTASGEACVRSGPQCPFLIWDSVPVLDLRARDRFHVSMLHLPVGVDVSTHVCVHECVCPCVSARARGRDRGRQRPQYPGWVGVASRLRLLPGFAGDAPPPPSPNPGKFPKPCVGRVPPWHLPPANVLGDLSACSPWRLEPFWSLPAALSSLAGTSPIFGCGR